MAGLNSITSPFFQNYDQTGEQNLLQDLIDEAATIHGQDCFYIPRNLNNYDKLLDTDDQSDYSETYMLAMYLENFEHWMGEGDLNSKFGFQIRDKVIWSVSRRSFLDEVGNPQGLSLVNPSTGPLVRPREGDLIYYPIAKRTFVIRYVDAFDDMFFQLGALQIWKMTTELFEYSSEKFNTGIPEIDQLQQKFSMNLQDWALTTEDGFYLKTENHNNWVVDQFDVQVIDPLVDNNEVEFEANTYLDQTEINPFSEGFDSAP